MKYPIYKKSKHVTFKSYFAILSSEVSIEIDTDELKIVQNEALEIEHILTDKGYEDATASEIHLAYSQVTEQ